MIVAGFHVPVIPLLDVAGRTGAVAFWHKGPIALNVGATGVVITISIVVTAPHCPVFGVKVYVVDPVADVLITAGFHVPIIPLFDVVGNAGAVAFWHNGPIWVNVGVGEVVTRMSMVAVVPH